MSRVTKVTAKELCPACKDAPAGHAGVLLKYASNGRDLSVPKGRHAWKVDHGTWAEYFLTRKEARTAAKR